MARKIHGAEPGKIRTYLPEPFGNREDPEPVEVDIASPTEAQKRAAMGAVRGDEGRLASVVTWQEAMVREHVKAVRRYSVRGVEILTGAQLAEHGETAIVSDVAAEILTEHSLTEQEKKVFNEPSATSPAKTPASTGTAASAGDVATTSAGAAA